MRAVLVATLVAAVLTVAVVAESADEDTSLEIPAFAKWRRFGRYRVASCLGKLRAAQAAQRTTLKDAETANIGISQALHHIQRLSQVQDVQELQEHSQKLDQLLTELEVPSGRSRSSVVNILARLKRSINRHKAHDSKQYNTLKSQCLHLCAVRKHSIKVFARRVYRWRSVLRKQYKMALASKTTSAYRKFKLRRLVRIANAKTQKARRAYTSTTRRCSVSHSYVRKSTSDSHRAKKSMKTNRAQKAMKKVMKRLFWSHTKHSRSLHHIRKTRHGKYAYTVVSHLKQSGLRVRFNKNTHVLHAIRVNPGAFPPKFSWKVTVSHGPVLSGSHPIVHHVLHKLVIKARKMNAVGAMAPTPVQKMRCFYIHKFIVWLRNYPRVIRMLRSWYFLSRRKAWSKYLKRGSMHVYKRKRAHLRAIYLHHLHKLSTVKVVVRRMMKKLILRNKIETIRAAIKASKAKKAPVKKISKPKSSAKSYPPMACPKGYSRNKDGVCKKGKSSAPSPQECGLNMVMVSGVCQCRRGFHSVGSNRCARNDARRHHLSRVCKKGFFYHRHRCVRRCPSPYKADDATRRCLNPNRKHTVTCGKNMKKSGGRCRCRAGYRRARGGAFCIKYKKNFHSCRKGWLLAGAKCVKKCPGHLLPDPKNRVCSVEGDIDARRAAAAAAAAKAAAAAARARAKARAVLRAKIRNLAQKHKNALARARAHAKKLHGARALAARLAALKARAQALLAAHKKAVGAARGRVARLAAAKAKLIAALKKVCAAHKRAMGSLKKLLAKSKRLADMASARDRALARARAAAKALAARHRAALLAAKKHAAALAAQRRILADREMSEERAKARAKARGLARRRAAMLAKARARARALEAKMRAAKAKAKRLAAARAAAANEALRLAKHRADQIARAKARAAALKKRAVAALTKCKKHRAALRKARRDAAKAAARRKAALAAAKAREHAHKAALARAKAAAKRRAEALMRARKRYLKAVKARSKCAKIKCGCPSKKVNKNCETFKKAVSKAVNRKVGRALRTLKKSSTKTSSKTSSKTSTSTKKTSTKTLPGVAKRIVKKVAKKKFSSIKKFIWRLRKRTTQRLAALKSKMRRLSQVAKKSHSKKTVKMVKTVARKIVRRIVLVKKAAVRLVSKVIKKTSKKTSRKILAFVSRHSKLKKMEKTKKGSWWARYKALKALRRRR